jgi:hypothetical protein
MIVNNMIFMSAGLLFAMAVLTVYAMIQLGKNNVITFFLIPLALVSSIFTAYTIFALQGTPVPGIPKGEVAVIWAEVQKPNIYFLVRHQGEETRPVYHSIPYTEDNAKKMNELAKQAARGQAQKGEFTNVVKKGDMSKTDEISFDNITRTPLPPKKKALLIQGVDQGIINAIHPDNDGP